MKLLEFFIDIAVRTADAVSDLTNVERKSDAVKEAFNQAGREADELSLAITRAGDSAERQGAMMQQFGKRVGDAGQRMQDFGARASIFVTLPIIGFLAKANAEASEAREAMASVEGTIISMGRAAEFSADKLAALATEQSRNTLYDNDVVMRDVTQNLLTFDNISEQVFGRAQQAIIDYAAGAKQDLRAASTQVAKALQTPEGATALSKTGAITRDDVPRLKKIAEENGLLAYQEELLKAIEKQQKGQAAIAAAANPAAMAAKKTNDAYEKIGESVGKIIEKLAPTIERIASFIAGLSDETLSWGVTLLLVAAAAGPIVAIFGTIVRGFAGIASGLGALKAVWDGVLIAFGRGKQIAGVLTGATKVGVWLGKALRVAGVALSFVGRAALVLGRFLLLNPIGLAISAIAGAAYLIYRNWDWLKEQFGRIWSAIVGLFNTRLEQLRAAWTSVKDFLNTTWTNLWSGIETTVTTVINVIKGIIDGLKTKIQSALGSLGELASKASTLPGGALGAVGGPLGKAIGLAVNAVGTARTPATQAAAAGKRSTRGSATRPVASNSTATTYVSNNFNHALTDAQVARAMKGNTGFNNRSAALHG